MAFTARQILQGADIWARYMDSAEGNRRPYIVWRNWADANPDIANKAMEMAEAAHVYAQRLNYPELEAA
ncbi:hypothetical protein [Phenylobacterium sp.]|uniref:hypothetical protein n=1 Tax=Phenylobacterium sp. TaxID=1871053 RepID=UPI00286E2B24|nr:hypothetical protein [Phenylobacterium sp.]